MWIETLKDEERPQYWMSEIGGELRPAVERYLRQETLTERDIQLLRLYLIQWIGSPAWKMNPHGGAKYKQQVNKVAERARIIASKRDIDKVTRIMTREGIDPW